MSREVAAVTLCAVLLAATLSSSAEVAVPPLKSRVTDLTSTLSPQQKTDLEQTLSALEQRKGAQVAVLLVPTVQPETVEQFAVRVFEQWKLGRKGVDDGVLLLVAKNDRKMRIEVGYGLEGVLNDATAKRIIEEEIGPRFKQANFYGGINAGVGRLVKLIDGEPLPPPKTSGPTSTTKRYQPKSYPSNGHVVNLLGIKLEESDLWFGGGFVVFTSALLISAIINIFWGTASAVLLTVTLTWLVLFLVQGAWSLHVFQTGLEFGYYVLSMMVAVALVGGFGVLMERMFGRRSSERGGVSGDGGGGGSDGGGGGGGSDGGGGGSGGGGASGSW